ncbi:MAG: autotransporter domain-containing protein [Candidatus Sphingomonas colombiensis]|nr:autotransporter outer membrane beta-barrel domain-containing protein [Sphingomonas sp.]WEK43421.1 MAG: autotransporter domain-containing protein [Sphingomonas sp.]
MTYANHPGVARRNSIGGRRSALLLGTALAPLAISFAAHAQSTGQTVVLEEGRPPVAVTLGAGDDRVVVDISRVDADSGVLDLTGLTTGPVTDEGGRDSVWLRATGSQTRNVVFTEVKGSTAQQFVRADAATGTPFDGGTVYEASGNDTVLTLENRSRSPIPADPAKLPNNASMDLRHGPMQFAGDGTVLLTFSLNAANQPDATQQAIRVLPGSTSQEQGSGGDGKLALVLDADVGGDSALAGLIDVRNAASLRVTSKSRVQILEGTAIVGGKADIILDANGWVNSFNAAFPDVTLIKSSGRVFNSTRVSVGGQNGSPTAQGVAIRLDGGKLYNTLTEAESGTGAASGGIGNIIGGSTGVLAASGDNYIENVGDIRASTGAAVESLRGTSVLRNKVWTFSKGSGTRAGTITGGMVDGRQVAYQGGSGTDMVVNSGTITGDIDLGDREDMFLFTGATNGVNGTIEGGSGLDGYGRSFSASATHTLSNDILGNGNSGFEMHGIEAAGGDTTVTVAAAATLDAGLMLVGNGSVVNTANINSSDFGFYIRDIANVARGIRVTNRGDVVSRKGVYGRTGIAGFVNEGLIRATEGNGVFFNIGELAQPIATVEFRNAGTIETESDDSDALGMQFDATNDGGPLADVLNTGTIRNAGSRESFDADEHYGVRLRDISEQDNMLRFRNDGLVEATGRGVTAVSLESARNHVVNSKTIRAEGMGASAVRIMSQFHPDQQTTTASLVNSGTISANGGAWINADNNFATINTAVGMSLGGANARGELVNSGTIEAMGSGSVAVVAVDDSGSGAAFVLDNDGTIRGQAETLFGEHQGVPEPYRRLAGAIHTFGTIDTVTNRGLIQGNVDLGSFDDQFRNYGRLEGDLRLGDGDDTYVFGGGSSLTGTADGGDGFDVIAVDRTGDMAKRIDASRFVGFEALMGVPDTAGTGKVSIFGNFDAESLRIGDIALNIDAGDTVSSAGGAAVDTFIGGDGRETINNAGTIAGGLAMGGGDDTLNNSGTIGNNVDMGAGNDVVVNSGRIEGNLNLGDGDDRYVALAGGIVTGDIDGGAGNNTFVFRLTGSEGEIPGSVLNFNSFGAYGPGTLKVNLDKGQNYNNLELLESANLVLSGSNGSVGNVIGDDSAQVVTIDGVLTGGVSLGGGDDTLNMTLAGLLEGALDGGAGTDTLNLSLTGDSTIKGMYGFEIANISGDAKLTLAGDLGAGQQVNFLGDVDNELVIAAGVKFEGAVNGGEGRDLLRVQSGSSDSRTVVASQITSFEDLVSEGAGTLALTNGSYSFESVAINGGNFELGANSTLASAAGIVFDGADNRFTLGSGATVSGRIDGGAGNDTLALVQGAGTTRLLSALDQTGFEALESFGAGELRIDRDAAFEGGARLNGGKVSVMQGYTLAANVTGGDGADTLAVFGTVDGNIDLGAGNDTLVIGGLGNVTGTRDGGEGTDRLVFDTQGTYAEPTVYDGTGFTGFEELGVAGGVVSLTGDTNWNSVAITGGRLIGQAGTTITSANAIQVAHGATFGSAGIVNGDINVAGTLSPGASPGTMTVNGNVNFVAGSNLLLEVSPTVSDLLHISGKMTIADGAAVDITGVLHGTPGNTLDLVVADGGITGRFTTINKSNDIFGFVVQSGNRLQIQSEFLTPPTYPRNVRASIAYANEVLRDGYGVQAFTAALPVLVDAEGNANKTAFAQLTPEAFGSALQLGIEKGLIVADGARAFAATGMGGKGFYSFGQFVNANATLHGQAESGAAGAHIGSHGFFGGIGYGLENGSRMGLFIGGLDSNQSLRELGAKTEGNSLLAGAYADLRLDSFGLHGLLAYDTGTVETKRLLAVSAGTAKSRYGLSSWVVDLSADYRARLGVLAITPKLGVTLVHAGRDAIASEQGVGDFGLSVSGGSKVSWFGDASLALSGDFSLGGMAVQPFAQAGVRHALNNGATRVSARFAGAASGFTVDGVERDRTTGRYGLGIGLGIADGVRVQASYNGEFSGTRRNNFMGGLSIRF